MAAELLPGEDPALLPGPDRVELYPVLDVHDINSATPDPELTMTTTRTWGWPPAGGHRCAHSTASFRVGNLGRAVTGAVPIIERIVDIGLPAALGRTRRCALRIVHGLSLLSPDSR
jgi:hypothetical protein